MDILTKDIKANGMLEPIKYVSHGGTNYIVDGHHRASAALRLGTQVPVQQVELPYAGYHSYEDLYYYGPWR